MTNLLDLPLDQFRGYLAEGNYPQARQDELMRAYRAQNSLSGLLDRYGEEGLEGKNVSTFFPVAGPGGMSIFDALKSGQLQTRFKDYASDALGGVFGALENPKASYDGTLPQADYDGAAMGTAGLAMGGGGVVAGRLPDGAVAANRLIGGGMSDPTQTGWTFKDVNRPQFSSAENREIQKRFDKLNIREAELPIRSMNATQGSVNPDFATTTSSQDYLPTVVKRGGEYFVRDGHHRLTKAAEAGNQNAKVQIIDLDNTDTSTPLLDYKPPRQMTEAELAEIDRFLAILDDGTVNANASKSAGLLAANIDDQVKMAKQKFLENPDDKILFYEYQNLARKRLDQKDQSAVLKAENRIIESAPSVDVSYRGSHQPRGPDSEDPVRLDDISISTSGETAGFPSDFYGPNGAKYYAPGPRFAGDEFGISNQQSYRAIINAKNNPDAEVTMYRAVPSDDGIATINQGDFVTLSPKYAEIHASEGYGPRGNDAGKVISQKVKVKDLYFAGDDVNEFGYFPNTNANASKSAGLLAASLPEPRNAGEAMAQRILEMRAAGKAGDVTNEMMAQADPQYMFNNTPLDMSEAARMARAEGAGFDVDLPLYHGTPASDLSYFDAEKFGAYGDPGLRGLGVYSTDNPLLAKSYADRPRFDHSIKTESVLKPARVPEEELSRGIIPLLSRAQNRADILNLPLMDRAKLSGISGSAYNERLPQNDGVKYTYTSKDPSSEFVDFNPANIRSRFARFDPEFSHLSNLSAANASKSAGLLAASLPEPRNAGGLLGAAQQTKTPTMPTRKQFQNNHLVHVDVKGRQGKHDPQEVKASVLKNGFTGGQLLPAYKGGTPTNIIDEQYAPRKGDVIYVIPPEGWESRNGMEYIKKGYKPPPNFIIEAPEDFIDVYDVFSKSQAKTRKKQ